MVSAREPNWWQVNIECGDGLVSAGNTPLPEPALTSDEVFWGVFVVNLNKYLSRH